MKAGAEPDRGEDAQTDPVRSTPGTLLQDDDPLRHGDGYQINEGDGRI